jgi:hypothetical protein
MEKYQHTPLQLDRFIRVLKLHASSDGNLNCSLLPVSLDKLPKFEALSYAWGEQTFAHHITCNGKVLDITANCEAALRRLALPKKSRLLWVDSICIDQTSIPERNQQVKLMGEIYGSAQRVLIWLGKGTPQSDIVFKHFGALFGAWAVSAPFGDKWKNRALNRAMELFESG